MDSMRGKIYTCRDCFNNALDDKTPFEIWLGINPTLTHFKIFGCKVHALIPKEFLKKKTSFHKLHLFRL
jgi:hypothetical protein